MGNEQIEFEIDDHNPFSGHWVVSFTADSLPGNCPAPFTLVIPIIGKSPVVVCDSLCPSDCVIKGDWMPEIPPCTDTDTIEICGPLTLPVTNEKEYDLKFVKLTLVPEDFEDAATLNVPFEYANGVLCVKLNVAGLQEQCYELSIVLEFESPNEGAYFEIFGNLVQGQENDLCLPLEDCCPEELEVNVTTLEFMPIFGDEECEEYIYSLNGAFLLPSGYVFCDSLPVFEGGYFIYDDIDYFYAPPLYNMVLFEGHLYITDYAQYFADSALYGQMIICDVNTDVECPASIELQYRAPMEGMMCNFTHCIDEECGSCEYDPDDPVPVESCITLHFPDCGTCGVGEYFVSVYRPNQTTVLFRDTIDRESEAINQEYCLDYTYPYVPSSSGCFYIKLETDCGHVCWSSICLDYLDECDGYRRPVTQSPKPGVNKLLVFPNPVKGYMLNIQVPSEIGANARIEVYDLNGKEMISDVRTLSSKITTLNTGDLVTGTYLLCVTDLFTGRKEYVLFMHIAK